jgi:hypothetical protein
MATPVPQTRPGPWGSPVPPRRGPGPRGRVILVLLGAALLAGLSVAAMGWGWEAMGASPMTVHGWIALSIGAVGTALLAAGLMLLAFHSNRSGHDDRVESTESINERIRRRF